jgi:hypothetical protein
MADFQADRVECPVIQWDAKTVQHLKLIAGENDRGIAHYRNEVETGRMTLRAINLDGERVGTFCYFIDTDFDGDVFFIAGMGIEPAAGASIAKPIVETIIPPIAKAQGCKAARFWTKRQGFVRLLSGAGFEPIYVMEKTYD